MRITGLLILTLMVTISSCTIGKTTLSHRKIFDVSQMISRDSDDHTKEIQRAIDHCMKTKIDTLFFPAGIYNVGSVDIYPGLVFIGEKGTIMRKIPLAGKWSRMFTTQNNTYLGDVDSEMIVFKNIHFDGNKDNQGPYKKYQLQQQHILYFDANPKKAGRIKALVEGCSFENSVADAISGWRNSDILVKNCEAYNVFRGGVVVTGGHSKVQVENFIAGGEDDKTGIDIEIDAYGFGGKKDVEVTLKNVTLAGDFDIGIPEGGVLIADNVQVSRPGFFLSVKNGGTAIIKNSSFVIGTIKGNRIYFPGDVFFENCDFTTLKSNDRDTGLTNYMETSYRRKGDQTLKFKACNFYTSGSGNKNVYAIHNQENFTHLETNKLIVEDCVFDGDFTAAIFFNKGGNAEINNVYFKKGNAIKMNSVGGKTPMKLSMDDIRIGEDVGSIIKHSNPSDKDEISIKTIFQDDITKQKSPSSKQIIVDKVIDLKTDKRKVKLFTNRGILKENSKK